MDKHLGVFITLMNNHLHVSLSYALRVNTHHVTHPVHGPKGRANDMSDSSLILASYLLYMQKM